MEENIIPFSDILRTLLTTAHLADRKPTVLRFGWGAWQTYGTYVVSASTPSPVAGTICYYGILIDLSIMNAEGIALLTDNI